MKFLALLISMLIASNCLAQFEKLESVSVSYLGEMVSHPGLKISADFSIKEWDKTKITKKDSSKRIRKSFLISPALSFFYHKRYQTGLFIMPETKYTRQNPKGGFYALGIGLGYLRTFIPNTYDVNSSGEVNKSAAGHNYFATNYFISFGKDLSIQNNLPIAFFIKPQFIYAIPNFPNGTGYFAIELGVRFILKNRS